LIPFLLELDALDKPVVFELLDNPRTLPAVYADLFPEFALEHAFRL